MHRPLDSSKQPKPTVIDDAFEAEARAMARAMKTGDLPLKGAPYYERVKKPAHTSPHPEQCARDGRRAQPPAYLRKPDLAKIVNVNDRGSKHPSSSLTKWLFPTSS